MESEEFNEVFESTIWDRREVTVKNLDSIQSGGVVSESIGQILSLFCCTLWKFGQRPQEDHEGRDEVPQEQNNLELEI